MNIKVQTDLDTYKRLLAAKQLPYFYQPWWLDAATRDGGWRVVTATQGEKFLGFAVYELQQRWWGKLLRKPPFTPHSGIVLYLDKISPSKRLALTSAVLQAIEKTVPDCLHRRWICNPGFEAGPVMQWLGYQQRVRYYNELDLTLDEERLHQGLSSRIRRYIKKGEQELRLVAEYNVESLYEFQRMAVERSNGVMDIPFSHFREMIEALNHHSEILSYGVYDPDVGKCLGRNMVLLDGEYAYSICFATLREENDKITGKLLTWESIRHAKEKGCRRFHFGGSMIRGVHEFNTSFGASAIPYYEFTKYKNRLWEALALFK